MDKIFIHYELGLKTPTKEFKEKGFSQFISDIEEAIKHYKKAYVGARSILLLDVNEISIHLLLASEVSETISLSARDLTTFSKYLYNNKDWKRLSRERSTLFYQKQIRRYLGYELSLLFEKFDKEVNDYIDPQDQYQEAEAEINTGSEFDEKDSLYSEDLSDDQCVQILRYVLSTKDLGSPEHKRQKLSAVSQIKSILYQFI
jgi:hypothetical protein